MAYSKPSDFYPSACDSMIDADDSGRIDNEEVKRALAKMKDGGMPMDEVTRIDETFQALMDDTVRCHNECCTMLLAVAHKYRAHLPSPAVLFTVQGPFAIVSAILIGMYNKRMCPACVLAPMLGAISIGDCWPRRLC